ncbi:MULTISPECIES: hypothetical protein [unclassified Streptomyces]|uniref:hypothetical protein n=1 Tax=unclassified Streptomyces TaxID=2593676 RepID=UPI0035E28701
MSRSRVLFPKFAAVVTLVALPALGTAALAATGTATDTRITADATPTPSATPSTGKDTTGWE